MKLLWFLPMVSTHWKLAALFLCQAKMKITILLLIPVFNTVCCHKARSQPQKALRVRSEDYSATHLTIYQFSPSVTQPLGAYNQVTCTVCAETQPVLSSNGRKIKTTTLLPMIFCILNRKTYRDICHPHNVPQFQKKKNNKHLPQW